MSWPRCTPPAKVATVRYTVLRLGSREVVDVRIAPVPDRFARALFPPRRRRHLHAAGRRRRAPAAPARSGHAAFLLALRRVLRRVHVLVQRPARSSRLGLLLGRRRVDPAAAAAVPPLHAGLPGAAAALDGRRAGRARCFPLIYVPAALLGAARIIALARSGSDARLLRPRDRTLDRLELAYLAVCFVGGLAALTRALGEVRSVTARRQLRWIAWGTALGAAPFALRVRAAVRRSASSRRCRWSCRRSR